MFVKGIIQFLTWGLGLLAIQIEVHEDTQELSIRENVLSRPALIAVFLYYCVYYIFSERLQLTRLESLLCSWFLHNGGVIHLGMEGLAAGWNACDEIYQSYKLIDKRFDFSTPELTRQNFDVFLITQVELFIWTPLCLITALCLSQKHPQRYTFALITSICHIVGTIFFVTPPIYKDCVDLPPFDIPGCFPDVTPFSIIFYYLAFGINFAWIIIPLIIIFMIWPQFHKLEYPI